MRILILGCLAALSACPAYDKVGTYCQTIADCELKTYCNTKLHQCLGCPSCDGTAMAACGTDYDGCAGNCRKCTANLACFDPNFFFAHDGVCCAPATSAVACNQTDSPCCAGSVCKDAICCVEGTNPCTFFGFSAQCCTGVCQKSGTCGCIESGDLTSTCKVKEDCCSGTCNAGKCA